jgi:hypothetical protein
VQSKRCVEPNSYLVRLSDGRLFRRTRWAINIDYSSYSSLLESHQPFPGPVPDRAMSLPTSEQPAPVCGPPLSAVLPRGCSTPLRGAASSLAVRPARSSPVAVSVPSVAPLDSCRTPLSSAVST